MYQKLTSLRSYLLKLYASTFVGDVYAWLVVFVLPLNSAVNPLLYTFTTPKYRAQLLPWGWTRLTGRSNQLNGSGGASNQGAILKSFLTYQCITHPYGSIYCLLQPNLRVKFCHYSQTHRTHRNGSYRICHRWLCMEMFIRSATSKGSL